MKASAVHRASWRFGIHTISEVKTARMCRAVGVRLSGG